MALEDIMEKIAVVTGASSGIGHATAKLFEKNGFYVYCLARRKTEDLNCIQTDITDVAQVKAAIETIVAEKGRIDVLVNNAGMGISGAIEDTDITAVKKIFDVNFFGSLYAIQAVLPYMRKQNFGTIINMSSAAAPLSLPFQAFYSATKSAIMSVTEALRIEVKPFNIKVTSLLPGDVKTDFTAMREKNKFDNPVYGKRIESSVNKMEKDEQNGMPAELMAKYVLKLAKSKNPPIYKVGGKQYAFLVMLAKFLPKRMVNYAIGKLYG